jgi:hypothetical protein
MLLGNSGQVFARSKIDEKNNIINISAVSFSDIQDHWGKETIFRAINKGYVEGYPDSTFRPDTEITRAEFLRMLLASTGAGPKKIISEPWYSEYIKLALKAGIYKETEYTIEQWNQELTRAEMAQFLIRYLDSFLQQPGTDIVGEYAPAFIRDSFWSSIQNENVFAHVTYDSTFNRADFNSLAEYENAMRNRKFIKTEYKYEYPNTKFNHAAYLYLATTLGLFSGYSDGKVHGEGTTTRAEAITIIERFLEIKNGNKLNPANKEVMEDAEFEWHKTNLYTAMKENLDLHIRGDYNYGLNHDQMKLETNDGAYSAELEKLIVVDMEDPVSVEKYGVDLENWQWRGGDSFYDIKDYPGSYLIFWKSKVSIDQGFGYANRKDMPITISVRAQKKDQAQSYIDFERGILNASTFIVDKRYAKNTEEFRVPAFILPKEYLTGDFSIRAYTPNIPYTNGEDKSKDIMIMKLRAAE